MQAACAAAVDVALLHEVTVMLQEAADVVTVMSQAFVALGGFQN